MIIPALHLNGSGFDNLVKPLEAAVDHINQTVHILHENYPHMRDYYVLPDGEAKHRQALVDHAARVGTLLGVADELNKLREGIYGQRDEQDSIKRGAGGTTG